MDLKETNEQKSTKKDQITTYALILAVFAILLFFFLPRGNDQRGSDQPYATTAKDAATITNFSITWLGLGESCVDAPLDIEIEICLTNRGNNLTPESKYEIQFRATPNDLVTFDPPAVSTFPALAPGENACETFSLPLSQLGRIADMQGVGLDIPSLDRSDPLYIVLYPASGKRTSELTYVSIGGKFVSAEELGGSVDFDQQMQRMLPSVVFAAFDALEPLPICVGAAD